MASKRSKKLAVSSTWYSESATLLGGAFGGGLASLLQLGQRGVCFKRATRCDVGQAALGVVDQQQVDAFALQTVASVE